MDLAGEAGRLLGQSVVAHTLSIEARRTQSPIFSRPMALEPAFRRFDRLITFAIEPETVIPRAESAAAWVTRELRLGTTPGSDWRAAEALCRLLVGCHGRVSVEGYIRRNKRTAQATLLVGATAVKIDFVAAAVQTAFPGSVLIPGPDPAAHMSGHIELLYDLYSPAPYQSRIHTSQSVAPWSQFLRLAALLADNETMGWQVLLETTRNPWLDNIPLLLDQERSLGSRSPIHTTAPKDTKEPIVACVVRIGATTRRLAASLEAFAGVFTAEGKPFQYRTLEDFRQVLSDTQIETMLADRASYVTGQLFSVPELAVFVHAPDPAAAGPVRVAVVSGLPVPDGLQGPGTELGVNTSIGAPIRVFHPDDHRQNGWWIGSTGTGKTSINLRRFVSHARRGHGVGIIDPHRSIDKTLLGELGEIDQDRIVYLDFEQPVAYNPFRDAREEDYGRLTLEFRESCRSLLATERHHRMTHILGMGVYALFVLKENLATLLRLFGPDGQHLRRHVIANAPSEAVRRFFEYELPTYRPDVFSPLVNRLSAVLLDPSTYRIFTQTDNRVDMARIMDEEKVLIVLPPSSLDSASIVGGMLIAQAKHAAFRRSGSPQASRHFHLIIDEFHRFLGSSGASGASIEQVLNETRKGGLTLSLLQQETAQLPAELVRAMFTIANIFVLGVNLPDAQRLAPHFYGHVTADTLASQPTGSVHARLGRAIVNFQCPPPLPAANPDVVDRIIAASRAKYHVTAPATTERPARQPRIIETF